MSRRSSSKQVVVLSRDEATSALAQAGELDRRIAEIDLRLVRRTGKIKEVAFKKAEPLKKQLDDLKKQLCDFYEASPALLEADTRAITLATGLLSKRLGNWTVHLAKEIDEDPRSRLPEEFVRTVDEADREAILRNPELAITLKGVDIDRIDRFYLQPAGVVTGIAGASKKLRYDPKAAA